MRKDAGWSAEKWGGEEKGGGKRKENRGKVVVEEATEGRSTTRGIAFLAE